MNHIIEHENFLRDGFNGIHEARGIYNLTYNIINTCYEFIKNNIDKLMYIGEDRNVKIYRYDFNVPLDESSFIVNPIIQLTVYLTDEKYELSDNNGGFVIPDANMIQNNKLMKPIFIIKLFEQKLKHVDYEAFQHVMIHEIHHAYRWFKINTNSPNDEKELKRNQQYLSFKSEKDKSEKDKSEIDTLLYQLFYFSDLDEINVFKTEIYSVVKKQPKHQSRKLHAIFKQI